jgi:hypothetical protein
VEVVEVVPITAVALALPQELLHQAVKAEDQILRALLEFVVKAVVVVMAIAAAATMVARAVLALFIFIIKKEI